jgi:hypothetical protein
LDVQTRPGTIGHAFARASKSEADAALARCIILDGLPFKLVTSPYFKDFLRVVSAGSSGYKPPAYNTLRTKLLDDTKASVEKDLKPFDTRTKTTGCSVISDGWDDAQHRPLLNSLAVNPKGVKFIDAVDTSGHTKDAQYIASILIEAIEEVGPDNVVQVVTDTPNVCKAAGRIVEAT